MTTPIQDKESILQGLREAFTAFHDHVSQQDDSVYTQATAPGKWSTAQHLDHLIRSTLPLNKALRMLKVALRTMFGKCKRPERSYDETIQLYEQELAAGAKAMGRYVPPEELRHTKQDSLRKFKAEGAALMEIVEKWEEKRLSQHLLPHPVLGKMTVREMLFFTINHTYHHLRILQKS